MSNKSKKVVLVVGLQLVIAFFFVLGVDRTNRSFYILYQSYFADIFLPFGFYFLLTLVQDKHPVFKKWQVKALSIFTLCSTSEILQFFGIFALARVFDPLDFVMYGTGVLLAVFVDRQIFSRYISFWNHD